MQDLNIAIAGVACLLISGVAAFKLAPRQGKPDIPWMEREPIAFTVVLALLMLITLGIGLLYKGAF